MIAENKHFLGEYEKLLHENFELHKKLNDVNEVIEGIKKGNIDAVFIPNNESTKVLVSKTADLTYRRFIENMSEGVVTVHPDGIILYGNSSFARIFNIPLESVIGTDFRDFIPIEFIEKFEKRFKEHPQNNSKIELSILNHEGRRIHFIVSLNSLHLQDFEALNLVWTNVTDQKNAEEKLININESLRRAIEERIISENVVVILNDKLEENIKIQKEANVELATFAHMASHDLQEPLRKIITYCGRLSSDYNNLIDPKGQKYLNILQSASERMRNLINDILKYSELSQDDFTFEPTNLQSIVNEIISDFEIVIQETQATITIEKELPVIEANSSQMRQLFQNILSNSLKFIKDDINPQISITYETLLGKEIDKIDESMVDESFYRFQIMDNGIGINPEYISKIFTIFQRLNNHSVYKGTGIGLAICKKIVEKHNGLISAESKLDGGSLFTIILPVSHKISQGKGEIVNVAANGIAKV